MSGLGADIRGGGPITDCLRTHDIEDTASCMAALQRRHFFIAGCAAIFLAGMGAGVWTYHRAEKQALEELTGNALRCAVAMHGQELQSLTGTRADLTNPAYATLKERLIELRHVQDRVRF